MKSYKEFRASMSKKKKEESYALYKECKAGLEGPPIYCGPEARARAKGKEALSAYIADCAKYVKKINIARPSSECLHKHRTIVKGVNNN